MPEELAHDLPEEVYQLGEPIEAYPRSLWKLAGAMLLWLISITMGVLLLVMGIGSLAGWIDWDAEGWMNGLALLVGVAALGFGLWMFLRVLARRNQCVLLFTDGFARIQGKKAEVCRWDEVIELTRNVTVTYHEAFIKTTEYVYKIRRRDGSQIVINSDYDRLKHLAKLGDSLARESCRAAREQALAEWHAGRPVTLGRVTISRDGLTFGNEMVPWNDIKSLSLTGDRVVLGVESRWINWPDSVVCNLPSSPVFLELVELARANPTPPGG